jgi:hypothetical protein
MKTKLIRLSLLVVCCYPFSVYSADNEIYIQQSGATANIDVEQLGSGNLIGGTDAIAGTMTALDLDGANTFNIQTDPTNTFGADNSNVNVDVTGGSNTMTLNQATSALASGLDLDWIIQGSDNSITASIDYDGATNYMDIDGSDNTVTFDADGYAGGYFKLEQDGSNRTFNIQQQSTLDNDWLRIISTGSNGTICVIQNDGGTSTSC